MRFATHRRFVNFVQTMKPDNLISVIDIVGILVTLLLSIKFLSAIIHAYKNYFKYNDSVKFSDSDFSFLMIGIGYIVAVLVALF